MAEQYGLSADELLLIDDRWSWALRLLSDLVDDEDVVDEESGSEEPTSEAAEATGQVGSAADLVAGYDPDDPQSNSLTGDAGDDMLDGMEGADDLSGGRGDDLLDGGGGGDRLLGGDGDDMLLGQAGGDDLYGGAGDDDIGGDGGSDRLTGGDGSDIFSFDLVAAGLAGVDTITDFARGQDLLWIMGDGAGWLTLDSDDSGTLDDDDLSVSIDADGMRIALDGMHSDLAGTGAAILLQGIVELDRGDVVLVGI